MRNLKPRTKYFAVIFDPEWSSDDYRYCMQEVFLNGHEHDPKYSYSAGRKYMSYKSNCLFASEVIRLDIDGYEIEPTNEIALLDQIEDRAIHAADVALQKTLDPIRARKTELAMLTHQPEHSFPGSDWLEPDPDDKEFHDSPDEEDAMLEGHPLFNPEK